MSTKARPSLGTGSSHSHTLRHALRVAEGMNGTAFFHPTRLRAIATSVFQGEPMVSHVNGAKHYRKAVTEILHLGPDAPSKFRDLLEAAMHIDRMIPNAELGFAPFGVLMVTSRFTELTSEEISRALLRNFRVAFDVRRLCLEVFNRPDLRCDPKGIVEFFIRHVVNNEDVDNTNDPEDGDQDSNAPAQRVH